LGIAAERAGRVDRTDLAAGGQWLQVYRRLLELSRCARLPRHIPSDLVIQNIADGEVRIILPVRLKN
jgi:hypothetical protein